MSLSFFSSEDNYQLLALLGVISGLILLTKSKKTLSHVFEQYVMPHIGDIVQSTIETKLPDTFFYDTEDNSTFNQNCYAYLVNIQKTMPLDVAEELPSVLQGFLKNYCVTSKYSPFVAYGNIYKAFFLSLEEHILTYLEEEPDEAHKRFIHTLFANDNHVLDNTFKLIKPAIKNQSQNITELRTAVKRLIDNNEKGSSNVELPSYKRTLSSRGVNVSASTVREQYTTNIPTIRDYAHQQHLPFKEYRFGTQAQRVKGQARINPFFQAWSHIQSPTQPGPIAHIYFNNLTIDRATIEGRYVEVPWSKALHQEEADHMAVVTLPADKGLFSLSALDLDETYSTTETLALFTQIAMEKADEPRIKDFHISPYIRSLLYENETKEKQILDRLLKNTLKTFKLDKKEKLTAKERQALYFHFIKLELTDTIINILQPDSINFACKDAIDRAGVSSLYFNLMKSIETGHPMTYDEFLKGLHAAPVSVKGRALNHHFNIVHNVLSLYTEANHTKVSEACPWLIEWCTQFNPSKCEEQSYKQPVPTPQ